MIISVMLISFCVIAVLFIGYLIHLLYDKSVSNRNECPYERNDHE